LIITRHITVEHHDRNSLSLEWNCVGIWETGINAIADALSVNQSIEELDLRNNKIGPQSASILAHQIKHNTTLRRLDLRWNNVGLVGGRALLDVLKWNKTVLYLELAGNEVPEDLLRAIGGTLTLL
jgi:Ran GTPase-activating protein (RanGAP) involved in mRNA processing and transport